MIDSQPLPVHSPPPPAPMNVAPKKEPEDINIEVYKKIFEKCLIAADDVVVSRLLSVHGDERRNMTLEIAKTIFDRFYDDQNALKQGRQQAEAMLQGLTQVLEGRR